MSQRLINVCGQDPSLRNWGLAIGTLNLDTFKLTITKLDVVCAEISKHKQVRQNSLDLESAYQLYQGAVYAAKDAHAVFVEVPVGSQSARAMASYGICVGVLGALRANNRSFYEVTPTEVKMASYGSKTASKEQMIKWAMFKHPEANWPMKKENGINSVVMCKAEHMADAIGAIYAGITSNLFKQTLSLTK